MARKKISPPPPPERDDDDDDGLVPEPPPRAPEVDEDASSEIAGILAELGGASDASISVNKVTLQGEERLGKFMPREFDVDSLRDRYGGGVYWIYFHMGGKLHTKRRVVFARTLEEQRGGDPGAARSSSPTSSGDAMLQALDRMAQQQRELLNTVVTVLTSNRAPATDPMMIISAAEKLANLGNRSSGGDDLERLMRLAKFAREFGGGDGDGGSGLAGAAMEFVRLLREQAPAPQLPAPAAGGQPAAGDAQQMMILVRRALAERLPMLIRGAQSETDPGVYAQLVLDQVPQPFIAPLLEQLQKPEWFTVLVQSDGRVVPHQAWFEALRNEILQATSQDQPPES